MKKFILFLGLNDKDSKQQEITTVNAYKVLMNYLDGATITDATGFYRHEDGALVVEKSLKIEVLDFDGSFDLRRTVADLKRLFNQESIAVQTEIISSELM